MATEVISVEEFQRRVLKNIEQANREARELAKELLPRGVYIPKYPKAGSPKTKFSGRPIRRTKPTLTARQIAYRTQTCKACGCPWDDHTLGCRSCHTRHFERAKAQTKKAGL